MLRQLLQVVATPLRALANREFVEALNTLIISADSGKRSQAFARIAAFVRHKQLMAVRSRGMTAAKGFSKSLLHGNPEIFRHLASTPHLGALQPLSAHPLTRADYAALQLDLLLQMKIRQRGLGLGSPGADESSATHAGKVLTGLELTQTWATLLNWGHLFGTFATERALLTHLCRHPDQSAQFLDPIDERLRDAARRIVEGEDMYRFVHALTAYRVSRASFRPGVRETLIRALQLYFDESGSVRLARLRQLFRQTRQMAGGRGVKTFHLTHERRWKELAMGPRANPPRRLAVWALSRTQVNSHREIASALRMSEGRVAKVLCRVRNEFTPGQLFDRMKTFAGRHVESGRA